MWLPPIVILFYAALLQSLAHILTTFTKFEIMRASIAVAILSLAAGVAPSVALPLPAIK